MMPGKSRPDGFFFRATLRSGSETAKPMTLPSRSAKQMTSGTTTGLSCLARWSISASVIGTKPQFFSHASL